MDKFSLGVIGYGNMATAIINGILNAKILPAEEILVSEIDEKKLEKAKKLGMSVTSDNTYLAKNCDYILLSVKPQIFNKVIDDIKVTNAKCVLSIMAGIKSETIKHKFESYVEVVRVMPNTPCFVQKGMIGLAFDNSPSENNKDFALEIFNAIGKTVVVKESNMDNVSSISGSGPAYCYMFANSLIKAGVQIGLDFDTAKTLTFETILGSMEMIKDVNSIDEIDDLINAVCSKGGSTIEAVKHMQNNDFYDIMITAIEKCKKRNIELSENE